MELKDIENGISEVIDETEEGGAIEIPKVIVRANMPENLILYNQLEVDPYSCGIVGSFTAISNLLRTRFAYQNMKNVMQAMVKDEKFVTHAMVKDGKFAYGGCCIDDVVHYVAKEVKVQCGKTITPHKILITPTSIINALPISPIVTGIKYGKGFLQDEQDNAWIDNDGSVGSQGHMVTLCKINSMDDILAKYLENYDGKIVKINGKEQKFNEVIGFDLLKMQKLGFLFKTGYYFTVD